MAAWIWLLTWLSGCRKRHVRCWPIWRAVRSFWFHVDGACGALAMLSCASLRLGWRRA